MKLTARTVTQDGTVFYETAIPSLELIDDSLFRPDRWNPINNEGYQRELSQEHSRRIQQYLRGELGTNVLPTNVIINSRKPLQVKNLGNGLVEIEVSSFPLFVIDGQHRITALRQAEENGVLDLNHYEVGVTLTNFNLRDEMIHFRNINGRSNRPPKALSDLLMGKLAEQYGLVPASLNDQGLIRANKVVMRLATDIESPWYGKVALGGTRRRGFHLTTQSAVAKSMLSMFTSGRFSDPDEDPGKIYRIFKDFWQAVAEVWPQAAENPQAYQLMRPAGMNVWHKILSRILTNLAFQPTKETFVVALQKLREDLSWDDAWWGVRNFEGAYGLITMTTGSTNRGDAIAEVIWKTLDKDAVRHSAAADAAANGATRA
jgi:DGQHR domain-containing protein